MTAAAAATAAEDAADARGGIASQNYGAAGQWKITTNVRMSTDRPHYAASVNNNISQQIDQSIDFISRSSARYDGKTAHDKKTRKDYNLKLTARRPSGCSNITVSYTTNDPRTTMKYNVQ